MRFCRNCGPGRSPAPPCCSHDPRPAHRHRRQTTGATCRSGCLIFSKVPSFGPAEAASGSTPMPRWFSRRRSRLEDQAGRAAAVPRLLDTGEAQARLRGGAEGQRRQRPGALPARCRHHAQCRWQPLKSTAAGTPVEWAVEMSAVRRQRSRSTVSRHRRRSIHRLRQP